MLQQRFNKVLAERDGLMQRCGATTRQADQKAALNIALTERNGITDSTCGNGQGAALTSAKENVLSAVEAC